MTEKVDEIIETLLSAVSKKPGGYVHLIESDIRWLCGQAQEIFLSQPMLLELDAPLKICGDIHGQYYDLLRIFQFGGYPPDTNYLFLGDYVDRGRHSLETICLLLAYKIKYPLNFYLLRGNHESEGVNVLYGFYDECKRRYGTKLWKIFTFLFNCMPVAAIIEEKIFCCHGGLSPDLEVDSVANILKIKRPTDVPNHGLLSGLLWSDPEYTAVDWQKNDRGSGYFFGPNAIAKFLNRNDFDLICRGHEVVEDGYQFFAQRKLVTLFSAPNYCGEFKNSATIMDVDENLKCEFLTLEPVKSMKFRRGPKFRQL